MFTSLHQFGRTKSDTGYDEEILSYVWEKCGAESTDQIVLSPALAYLLFEIKSSSSFALN
jgi:hypothetical protein